MNDATIRETLRAAAAPFSTAPPPAVELLYGALFSALAPDAGPDIYPLALEFVYEGYLSHYRVGRLLAPDTTLQTRLLAGDHFDASGLRLVARSGDLDAVKLLTRLMASCSWLRAEGCPFAYDDDLWVLCVAGMASSASGGNAIAAMRAFDEVGRVFERHRVERLPEVVRRAAPALWLRDAAPLRAALGLDEPPHGTAGGEAPHDKASDGAAGDVAPGGASGDTSSHAALNDAAGPGDEAARIESEAAL